MDKLHGLGVADLPWEKFTSSGVLLRLRFWCSEIILDVDLNRLHVMRNGEHVCSGWIHEPGDCSALLRDARAWWISVEATKERGGLAEGEEPKPTISPKTRRIMLDRLMELEGINNGLDGLKADLAEWKWRARQKDEAIQEVLESFERFKAHGCCLCEFDEFEEMIDVLKGVAQPVPTENFPGVGNGEV